MGISAERKNMQKKDYLFSYRLNSMLLTKFKNQMINKFITANRIQTKDQTSATLGNQLFKILTTYCLPHIIALFLVFIILNSVLFLHIKS